ncbi:MAG: FtsL-like putative cell division protein [Spirochaetia bacterium]|nr:FtsL-like putative cell division protein [Spirochaetia bacterium]
MLKKEIKESDIKNIFFLFFVVSVCTLLMFIYLWRNIQMANLEHEIEQLKKDKKKLSLEVESLNISIAGHTSPEKIEKILQQHDIYLPVRTGKHIVTVKLPPLNLDNKLNQNLKLNSIEDMK